LYIYTLYFSGTKDALTQNPDGFLYDNLVTIGIYFNDDRMAFKQMEFNTTENLAEADAVVGGSTLDEESLAAVQAGTPYVAADDSVD
jgi:hypothetical protein